MHEIRHLLKEMVMIPALSGYETRMARHLSDLFEPVVDSLHSDSSGNLTATVQGKDPGAPRIMVFAHMDQLGLVVRRIDSDGLIRFERLGGIPEKVLPGNRVLVESEEAQLIPGVIGIKAHHATKPEEKATVIPYAELFVDIGASSASQVRELGIQIGCPIVYEPRYTELLGGRISATSIDDRGGCAVLVQLARRLRQQPIDSTVHLVGSVQEEFNLRGALVAASRLKPALAISLDLVVATDTPDLRERGELQLGGGPVVGMYSFHGRGTLNGTIPHPSLVRHFRETARNSGIPIQRSANLGSLTDSAYVQLAGEGIPCIDLGFPVRYTHTPVETCDLRDLEGLLDLTFQGLSGIRAGFSLARQSVPGDVC